MTTVAFFDAIEIGLLYALVALGVYLSFRILEFPDLTVDGSFPLGGAVAATLIIKGVNPLLATIMAFFLGTIAGCLTAFLNVKLKILNLLASILTMIGLYSINLRIMGAPNLSLLGQNTIITPIETALKNIPDYLLHPLWLFIIIMVTKLGLDYFLNSELGLALRATGANFGMAKAQGIPTDNMIILGIALSNGLVALGGALFAQIYGFADVTMGVGTIVFGLASVIIGETFLSGKTVKIATLGAIIGAVIYRLAVTIALNVNFLGLQAQDLNLITSVLVAIALVLPQYHYRLKTRFKGKN
ncbi:MAG: ABC transporter permease [Microcoleaceae cyanobacterium]|jgi:putative ABC transport system permease protein